jgi:hypothetical protein
MIGLLDWKDEEVQASIMNSVLNIILRFLPHFHGAITIKISIHDFRVSILFSVMSKEPTRSKSNLTYFKDYWGESCANMALFILNRYDLGVAHNLLCEGDRLALVISAEFPMILRQYGDVYQYVKPGYIDRLEDGSAWMDLDKDTLETFIIV